MDKKQVTNSYLKKSEENYKLYELLTKQTEDESIIEWQAVSIFYSSLCYVKAYLYSKPNMPEDALNSHVGIKKWLLLETNAKRHMIYEKYYNFLYNYSRDARYKCNKITKPVIAKMLEKHNLIKKYLKVT